MILYNGQLKVLYDMVCRKKHLETKYAERLEQKNLLTEELLLLQQNSIKEQEDVDKLEGGSLSSFFYYVIRKRGEKITKEKEEAYIAAMKYEAAQNELIKLNEELRVTELEIARFSGCEDHYKEVLDLKKERMKTIGHCAMEEIFEYDQRLTYLDNQTREIDDAINSGKYALQFAKEILYGFKQAENSGLFDIWIEGMIADKTKYSKVDESQNLLQEFYHHLRKFKTELSDKKFDPETEVQITKFLQFADNFIDGLHTDWTVLLKLEKSKDLVMQIMNQVQILLEKLLELKNHTVEDKEKLQNKLDILIVQSDL